MNQERNMFDKATSLGLKGIAIILMLMHHMYRTADRFSEYGVSLYPFQERTIIQFSEACKICVGLFAFITGYGLFLSYQNNSESTQKWIANRYIKTFSGYWFAWIVSSITLQIIFNRLSVVMFHDGLYNGIVYSLINFLGLSSLFNTPTMDYRWWYMSAAAAFIFLTPFVYKHKNELGLVLIGEIFFLRVLFIHYNDTVTLGGETIYGFISPYILGTIFARYNFFDIWFNIGSENKLLKLYKFVVEAWLLLLIYRFSNNIPRDIFWEFHYGIFPTAVALFSVEFILQVPLFKRLLVFLGKHSYNMYLMHSFVLYFYPRFIYQNTHFIIALLKLLCVSIILSFLLELLKKIVKYNELIKHFCNSIR